MFSGVIKRPVCVKNKTWFETGVSNHKYLIDSKLKITFGKEEPPKNYLSQLKAIPIRKIWVRLNKRYKKL